MEKYIVDGELIQDPSENAQNALGQAFVGIPTQVVHPWRTAFRTIIQHVSGLIVNVILWLLAGLGIDLSSLSAELIVSVSIVLTTLFAGLVARLMATEPVEHFLQTWFPPLATGVSTER